MVGSSKVQKVRNWLQEAGNILSPISFFFFSLCSSLLAFYDPNAWSRLAKISHFKLNFKLFTLTWLNTVVKGHYLPGLSNNSPQNS